METYEDRKSTISFTSDLKTKRIEIMEPLFVKTVFADKKKTFFLKASLATLIDAEKNVKTTIQITKQYKDSSIELTEFTNLDQAHKHVIEIIFDPCVKSAKRYKR